MLDLPTRALIAVTAVVVAVALTTAALRPPGGPAGATAEAAEAGRAGGTRAVGELPPWATATAVPAATERPSALTRPITIALGGDVHGEPPIADLLAEGENPLAGVAELLEDADLAVVNLETAVGSTGSPADKDYAFQADPALADALADAGVDVVTLANNHALDYGPEAAAETVAHVEQAGLAAVGYGEDAEAAYAPHLVEVGGGTVAVLGLTRVMPWIEWAAGAGRPGMASAYDRHLDLAVAAVEQAARAADVVVVAIHWGRELHTCPDGEQQALARALVDAGADVVAGHHAHVLQGGETIDGALVAYGLGNLVFYARTPATRQSGVLTVTVDADGVVGGDWAPAVIDDRGRPQPVPAQLPIPEDPRVITTGDGPDCGPPG